MKVDHILKDFEEEPAFDCYKKKTIKERKNGTRTFFNVVHKPNEAMEAVHQELTKVITERLHPLWKSLPNAISVEGVTSQSIFFRLERKRYITKLDLFHAYGSVKVKVLAGILKELFPSWGSEAEIVSFLRKYCCNDKVGLFYGAPASTLLFNLYCEKLIDKRIRDFLPGQIGYMRYIDDLIFFSRDDKVSKDLLHLVREVIEGAGFFENQWKAKSVDRFHGPIVVLGRQLGCIAPADQYVWRSFSKSKNVGMKMKKLLHSVDPTYQSLPRRAIGLPTTADSKKSLQALEIEMYRAAKLGLLERSSQALVGKMTWFVDSVFPKRRRLSRVELKIVRHYVSWAQTNGQPLGFLKKLGIGEFH